MSKLPSRNELQGDYRCFSKGYGVFPERCQVCSYRDACASMTEHTQQDAQATYIPPQDYNSYQYAPPDPYYTNQQQPPSQQIHIHYHTHHAPPQPTPSPYQPMPSYYPPPPLPPTAHPVPFGYPMQPPSVGDDILLMLYNLLGGLGGK